MKRSSTKFLQLVILLIACGALAFMLGEPHLEGRNKHSTLFEVYFKDPLLAYVYFASTPFFIALYQAFKVLGYAGKNHVFSYEAVLCMRIIKYCALAIVGFVVVSVFFMPFNDPGDDGPQGVVMRIFATFGSIVIAAAAAMIERVLQNAVEIKSENDLTV